MNIETLPDGYARKTKAARPLVSVRPMTLDEIKALRAGQRVAFAANDGTVRDLTINGAIKRWKRSPDRVRVSIKYGMYEYAQLDTVEALERLRVKV
jgi:hypothetical protein|tara:strand:- start:1610 stop:1897 length:288 start_codon:yes stop_codon:yes gene_type:complete